MEKAYKAVRVAAGVPIWSLFEIVIDNGKLTEKEIGSLTSFPNEGPMATVSKDGEDITVSGVDLKDCLTKAKEAYEFDHHYDEDEDSWVAYARMKEDQAEKWAMQDPCWGTSYQY